MCGAAVVAMVLIEAKTGIPLDVVVFINHFFLECQPCSQYGLYVFCCMSIQWELSNWDEKYEKYVLCCKTIQWGPWAMEC
jgi:hypothetical protein